MKLFVWNAPYAVKYGAACIYVVAETEEQARETFTTTNKYGGQATPYLNTKVNDLVRGIPPTRVLDVPCAEIYEWSE